MLNDKENKKDSHGVAETTAQLEATQEMNMSVEVIVYIEKRELLLLLTWILTIFFDNQV